MQRRHGNPEESSAQFPGSRCFGTKGVGEGCPHHQAPTGVQPVRPWAPAQTYRPDGIAAARIPISVPVFLALHHLWNKVDAQCICSECIIPAWAAELLWAVVRPQLGAHWPRDSAQSSVGLRRGMGAPGGGWAEPSSQGGAGSH